MSSAEQVLRRVVGMVAELGTEATLSDRDQLFRAFVAVVDRGVADGALVSVVTHQSGRFNTAAVSGELARQADRCQFELGSGPCIEAISTLSPCYAPDLCHDGRWPDFTRWADLQLGLASVFSVAFGAPGDPEPGACLNLYSTQVSPLDDESLQLVLVLASYAGTALAAATNACRATNLEQAKQTTSDIGTAIGVIMASQGCSHEHARDLLRNTSQHANRKVSDLAAQVVETGSLPTIVSTGGRRRRHPRG